MKDRKRLVSILAGVMAGIMLLSLILGILPTFASAASSSEIRKQINSLQQDRENIKTEISELQKQYDANRDDIASIVAQKNIIDQEIGLLHQEMENINEQLSTYVVLIADQQDELDKAEARYDTLNAACKERIRAMEEEGELTYWSVLFRANSFSDLLDRLNMVQEIAASDSRRLEELSLAAEEVAASKEELNKGKAEVELVRQEQTATQTELDSKRAEADQLINQLIEKGKELQIQQEDLEKEDEDLLAEIARKEQEYNEAKNAEWLAYIATMTTPPPTTQAPTFVISNPNETAYGGVGIVTGGGESPAATTAAPATTAAASVNVGSGWLVPCGYNKMTSPFGFRESPTSGASTYHQGVDLSAPAGTPIIASRGGTVTSATYSNSAGYYVTINHGDGFSSIYMHMTNYVVSSGQQVSQGQVIGYVGKTGIATGNHLHFGIAVNGAYVNPCAYVGLY